MEKPCRVTSWCRIGSGPATKQHLWWGYTLIWAIKKTPGQHLPRWHHTMVSFDWLQAGNVVVSKNTETVNLLLCFHYYFSHVTWSMSESRVCPWGHNMGSQCSLTGRVHTRQLSPEFWLHPCSSIWKGFLALSCLEVNIQMYSLGEKKHKSEYWELI